MGPAWVLSAPDGPHVGPLNLAMGEVNLNREVLLQCLLYITMTSHEHREVWNHQSFDCLYNSLCRLTPKKYPSPHYWSFVRGIYWWPVNSRQKGPVTRKKVPFHYVIIKYVWNMSKYMEPDIDPFNAEARTKSDGTRLITWLLMTWFLPSPDSSS